MADPPGGTKIDRKMAQISQSVGFVVQRGLRPKIDF